MTLKLGADQQEEKYGETTPGFLRFCPLYKQNTAEKRTKDTEGAEKQL